MAERWIARSRSMVGLRLWMRQRLDGWRRQGRRAPSSLVRLTRHQPPPGSCHFNAAARAASPWQTPRRRGHGSCAPGGRRTAGHTKGGAGKLIGATHLSAPPTMWLMSASCSQLLSAVPTHPLNIPPTQAQLQAKPPAAPPPTFSFLAANASSEMSSSTSASSSLGNCEVQGAGAGWAVTTRSVVLEATRAETLG